MPDTKQSGLAALTGANTASNDDIEIRDVSDTTMAATGTNKNQTIAEHAIAVINQLPAAVRVALFGGAKSGDIYTSVPPDNNAGYTAFTQSRLYYVPIDLAAGTLDRIYSACGVSGASEIYRLGIYSDAGNNRPGALLVDGGTIDCSSSGTKSVTISQAVLNGRYWLCAAHQSAGAATIIDTGNNPRWVQHMPTKSDASAIFVTITGYYEASVAGALPANAGTLTESTSAVVPVLGVRYA